jgi:hypothetical protein
LGFPIKLKKEAKKMREKTSIRKGLVLGTIFVLIFVAFVGLPMNVSADVNVSGLVECKSEVTIDINPTNPNNQVIVGHADPFSTMNTFYTLDGGETWTLVPLSDDEDGLTGWKRGDPTVAFDENGNVYVGYGVVPEDESQVTVVVAKSTNGGQDYTQFTQVATNPFVYGFAGNDKWHLATGPDPLIPTQQNVYIAWTQNVVEDGGIDQRIVVSVSTDGGEFFSAPLTINDDAIAGIDRALFADPAVGPNGEVYIAWHDWDDDKVFLDVSLDGGINFGTDKLVTTSSTGFRAKIPAQNENGVFTGPTIDTDRSNSPYNGRLYITYTDLGPGGLPDTDIFVRYSDDSGAHWSARALVNDDGGTNSQFLPWLDVDQKTGLVTVVWYDARNDVNNKQVEVFLGISDTGGASFQSNILVSDATSDMSEDNPDRNPYNNFLEYIGVATHNLMVYPVWADNSLDPSKVEFFTDQIPVSPVDVYILVDLSASFTDDLPIFQDEAPEIIKTISASNPNIQFGLGKFEDYPIDPFGSAVDGDKAYERLVDLTPPPPNLDTDPYIVLETIEGLFTRNGVDLPESQLPALYQAATGAGQDLSEAGYPGASIPAGQQANFRDVATKLILLWTDAEFHQPLDPGDIPYPGPSFDDTVDAILALDPPKVLGIDSSEEGDATPDLEAMATATSAFAPPGGVDCDGDGIIDILEGEPLVCSVAPDGTGIGEAMISIIEGGINQLPIANANGPYVVGEGSEVEFDASGSSDVDGDPLEYRWDFNYDWIWDTTWSSDPTASFTWNDDHIGTVIVEVTDGEDFDTALAAVTVNNIPPTITSLDLPLEPVKVGDLVELTGTFTDPGIIDTHTASITWGDEPGSPGTIDGNSVSGSHIYTEAGVYTITLTVTDDDSGSDTAEFQYVVVYDPSAGFVTGGGWIDSPEGAYSPDPTLTGKATFGFVSKYKKGAETPTGNTEFQFHTADLNFHSDNYEWLVVAGTKAIFKGEGTINGQDTYKFILTAVDGDLKDSGSDKFRIKIWLEDEVTAEETIIYDNMLGAEDDEELDETTAIGGGSIVIHTSKK